MKNIIFYISVLSIILFSCKKDSFYSGQGQILTFSNDTLTFDTVFTTLGSVTRYFRVENPLKEAIKIDEISLAGLNGNQFRINVDGIPGTSIQDLEIPAQDYVYIFAEVTVDPNNQNNPFVLLDEISYSYNGVQQKSYLRAWGQNAYFHFGEIIEGDSIWQNDKPHVVVRTDTFPGVGVEAFGSLTILPGCQVYFNQGSAIFSDGPIIIGSSGCQDSVTLQTDRVEDLPNGLEFATTPGLWLGVILRNGATGSFNNVRIKNATYGIAGRWIFDDFTDFSVSNQPIIDLDKVQILHASNSSIFCLNSQLTASNCLFNDANKSLATLAMGGSYQFENCTFSGTGQNEAVALSNFASNGIQGSYGDLQQANFSNCIIYGGKSNEILLNNENAAAFNFLFENCLLRTTLDTDTSTYINCITDMGPSFDFTADNPFSLSINSPCIGAGLANGLTDDLYCQAHNSPKDIGAVAYQN
ncbi:hypothetical protein OAT96_00370 [Chitinophagales bacterium]|nr:hypothetical protein [Chitinophagales bacterium]